MLEFFGKVMSLVGQDAQVRLDARRCATNPAAYMHQRLAAVRHTLSNDTIKAKPESDMNGDEVGRLLQKAAALPPNTKLLVIDNDSGERLYPGPQNDLCPLFCSCSRAFVLDMGHVSSPAACDGRRCGCPAERVHHARPARLTVDRRGAVPLMRATPACPAATLQPQGRPGRAPNHLRQRPRPAQIPAGGATNSRPGT